jgi:hypothetical protein
MWGIGKYVFEMTSNLIRFIPFSCKFLTGSRVKRRERDEHVEIQKYAENSGFRKPALFSKNTPQAAELSSSH